MKALGAWRGFAAATFLLAMLAAALAYLAIAMTTGYRLAGFLGAVLLFLFPSGYYMTRMLTESGVLAGNLAVIVGAPLVWRWRTSWSRPGIWCSSSSRACCWWSASGRRRCCGCCSA